MRLGVVVGGVQAGVVEVQAAGAGGRIAGRAPEVAAAAFIVDRARVEA